MSMVTPGLGGSAWEPDGQARAATSPSICTVRLLGTAVGCSENPWEREPKSCFWQVTPSCPLPPTHFSTMGILKAILTLCCNKKLAINYYKALLQLCGSPFYPLCFKWFYLLSLVFRNIKLNSICCKPSYFAWHFIAPSADTSST